MANTLQVRRGAEASLPTLNSGEFGFCTDTYQLYIGDGAINREVAMLSDISQLEGWTVESNGDLLPDTSGQGIGSASNEIGDVFLDDDSVLKLGGPTYYLDIYHTAAHANMIEGSSQIIIGCTSNSYITFKTNDANRWRINSTGEMFPIDTKTYDLGATGNLLKDVYLGDSCYLYLGDGQDLSIYHDSSSSYIVNDTGNTFLRSDGTGTGTYIDAKGSIYLRTGASFTTAMTINSSQNITFAADLYLNDGQKAIFGSSGDTEVYHNGTHGFFITNSDGLMSFTNSGAGDFSITQTNASGSLILKTGSYVAALTIDSSQDVTFANFPITPSAAPDADYEVANKKYVDDEVAGAGGGLDAWTEESNGDLLPDIAGQGIGSATYEIGDVYIGDSKYIYFGDSQDAWATFDATNFEIETASGSTDGDLAIIHNQTGGSALMMIASYGGSGLWLDSRSAGGDIVFRTGSSPTYALTIDSDQGANFFGDVSIPTDGNLYIGDSNELTINTLATWSYLTAGGTNGLNMVASGSSGMYFSAQNATGNILFRTGTTPTTAITIDENQYVQFDGRIGINTAPSSDNMIFGNTTWTDDTGAEGAYFNSTFDVTTSDTIYNKGLYIRTNASEVSSGAVNSGYLINTHLSALYSSATFQGTLANSTALWIQCGAYDGFDGTLTEQYGISIDLYARDGTIGTLYGVYVDVGTLATGSVTGNAYMFFGDYNANDNVTGTIYGIYMAGEEENYLSGALDVDGIITSNSRMIVSNSSSTGILNISGNSSSHCDAYILLQSENAVSSSRGQGVFYHNEFNDTEWYAGREYSGTDWVLNYNSDASSHQNDTADGGATDVESYLSISTSGILTLYGALVVGACGSMNLGSTPSGTTNMEYNGYFYATRVYNAVYNDIADFQQINDVHRPGRCYRDTDDGLVMCREQCQMGVVGIYSDTYGYGLGSGLGEKAPIAVAGWVLAYVDKVYEPGTPLTNDENGALTEMTLNEKQTYPERMVATYKKREIATEWGPRDSEVKVNGRHWVKVK